MNSYPRYALIGAVALSCALAAPPPVHGQEIDFSRIGGFESMGAGTAHTGSPPKTVVDDEEGHAVFLTIWNADTDSKVYWKPLGGGTAQTTVIHGTGVRVFQIDGLFKIQAIGEGAHDVKYDYLLLHLAKE